MVIAYIIIIVFAVIFIGGVMREMDKQKADRYLAEKYREQQRR
jgi:hypothetical protein